MEKYKAQLEPHLGKPLCDVPDPTGKAGSFGDHFLNEVKELMGKFGVHAEIRRMNDLYNEGKFDEWARFYLKNEAEGQAHRRGKQRQAGEEGMVAADAHLRKMRQDSHDARHIA